MKILALHQIPAPTDQIPNTQKVQATQDTGMVGSFENVDGGTVNVYLLRQSDGGIWTKTTYGASLVGAGASAEVRVPLADYIAGEYWAVLTDRPSNVSTNDLYYLTSFGDPASGSWQY